LEAPEPSAVSRASQRLRAGEPLEERDISAVLDHAVHQARKALVHGRGVSAEAVEGNCGEATNIIVQSLRDLGVDPRNIGNHQAQTLFGDGGEGATLHAFAVVHLDGRPYLLDATARQLFKTPEGTGFDARDSRFYGERLLAQPGGPQFAEELLRQGYHALDDDTANLYGQALREQDRDQAFSAGDYFSADNLRRALELRVQFEMEVNGVGPEEALQNALDWAGDVSDISTGGAD